MKNDYVSREYLLTEYDRQHQGPPGGARKIIAEAPPPMWWSGPDWITAEHLQEIFQADREGRLRIAARPIEKTCGSCRWFERETGKASGKCTRRTKRYRGGLDSGATMHVFQSRKACRSDYEKRSDEC